MRNTHTHISNPIPLMLNIPYMITNKCKYSPNNGFGWCLISREGIVLGIAHVGWWFPVLVAISCRNLPPSSPQRIGVAAASPAGDVQVPLVRTVWYAGTISGCHDIIHVDKCSGCFTVPSGKHEKRHENQMEFLWFLFGYYLHVWWVSISRIQNVLYVVLPDPWP